MYRGGYCKHVAWGAALFALLCAALVNVSCDALGNVKFPGDFVAGLEEARTTKITFYDKNPIENPNAKSAFRRYKFEYEFNINTEYPEELCPGGIPEEWKYIDFENPSAPPPVNVSVDSNGKIQMVYVTQRELCFYAEGWHVHTFDTTTWEKDATHHWHKATCKHTDVKGDYAVHVWGVTSTTAATCETEGTTNYICVCGKTKTETIAATGHTFATTWTSNATHHWHAATCGHTAEKKDKAEHTWSGDTCVCGKKKPSGLKPSEVEAYLAECVANGITDVSIVVDFNGVSGDTLTNLQAIRDVIKNYNDNPNLTSVDLELTGIKEIGDGYYESGAFYGCRKLTSIKLPNDLERIGDFAFGGCRGLTSMTIPSSVTSIGDSAFYNCSGLESVTIPDSVTTIEYRAFYNCSGLESVTVLKETPPALGREAFISNKSGRKIYVPAGSVDAYKAASGWSDYASYIEAIP